MDKQTKKYFETAFYVLIAIALIYAIAQAYKKITTAARQIPPANYSGSGATISTAEATAKARNLYDGMMCNSFFPSCSQMRCEALEQFLGLPTTDDTIQVYNIYNGITETPGGLRADLVALWGSSAGCGQRDAAINKLTALGLQ